MDTTIIATRKRMAVNTISEKIASLAAITNVPNPTRKPSYQQPALSDLYFLEGIAGWLTGLEAFINPTTDYAAMSGTALRREIEKRGVVFKELVGTGHKGAMTDADMITYLQTDDEAKKQSRLEGVAQDLETYK